MKELIEEEMKFLNEIINESRSGLIDSASLRLKCAKRLKALQKAKEDQLDMTSYLLGREDAKLDMMLQSELSKEKIKYPIGGYAPGHYRCKCVSCKEHFKGDKRAVQCEPCAIKSQQPELSAEEFLNKHTPFLVKSYNRSKAINPFVSASARAQVIKHLARKLTEFKNQNR